MILPYYDKDGITIYKGDCLQVMPQFEDSLFSTVLTSPPYNRKRDDKYADYTDIIEDYFGFLCNSIDLMRKKTKGNVFFNIQKNYYNKQDVFKLLGKYGDDIGELFIWTKSNPMPAGGKSITNSYEFIIAFGDTPKSNTTYTKNHIETSVAKMMKEHKAIMHPKIAEFFISNFTSAGDTVFDPFMGSGTTLITAKNLGRKAVGIEMSQQYCDIAIKRIEEQGETSEKH